MSDFKDYVYKPAIGFDTETHPFSMGNMVPPMVCAALSLKDGEDYHTRVCSVMEAPELNAYIEAIISQDGMQKAAHNCGFDLAVLAVKRPDLLPAIFDGLSKGIFECTIIREKLLHLCTHGDLKFVHTDDGAIKIGYGLADMVKRYLGIDRKGEKDETDSWRRNYNVLEKIPVTQWPDDAVKYVADDADQCLRIREIQEGHRADVWQRIGHDPFETQDFQVAVDFALQLMHAWGVKIDKAEKAKIDAELAEALRPEKMQKLLAAGILRPGEPAQPYKKGTMSEDGTPKMKKPVKESINTKALAGYIVAWAKDHGVEIKMTPSGEVSTAGEFFEEHAHESAIFNEYHERQKLQKLVTTELPRMNIPGTNITADIVHPCFDVLKKTGRTSSFASELYPSFNCQNVDPRVRNCFVPRDGCLMFSIDYNGMELGTLAQKVYNLFGSSVHRDKINANIDNHTYLGSQLAYALNPDFRRACEDAKAVSPDEIYDAFAKCKSHPNEAVRKLFAHYRKFAKPTGLGYPGGLGPKTFIAYAKGTYGIDVDLEMATTLRDIWHSTYPEMKRYFQWVNNDCQDPNNEDCYAYSTPFGMYRAGADFCSTANGAALQAFSAEGAKLGVFNVIRACYDATQCSILYGKMRPMCFIHDEILGEVPDTDEAHDLCNEAARLMVEAMTVVTPDVVARAVPCLMRRWNKNAEPVFKNGRLSVWEPVSK